MFPFMNGSAKLAGQRSEVRTSDRIRQDVEEGEEHCSDLQGETDEPDAAVQQQERDELEAKRDFWSVSGSLTDRHDVQQRHKSCVPQESSFPIPLKYIDVVRRTHNTGRIARMSD